MAFLLAFSNAHRRVKFESVRDIEIECENLYRYIQRTMSPTATSYSSSGPPSKPPSTFRRETHSSILSLARVAPGRDFTPYAGKRDGVHCRQSLLSHRDAHRPITPSSTSLVMASAHPPPMDIYLNNRFLKPPLIWFTP